jgi:hypothetical protein
LIKAKCAISEQPKDKSVFFDVFYFPVSDTIFYRFQEKRSSQGWSDPTHCIKSELYSDHISGWQEAGPASSIISNYEIRILLS